MMNKEILDNAQPEEDYGVKISFEVTRQSDTSMLDGNTIDKPKFKVKYVGSEYNVFETKDIAGVTFYGIEDEPNHIDYVQAENCEIVGSYSIKENGYPYSTKPTVFSGQKYVWSEEDRIHYNKCLQYLESISARKEDVDWFKSLKEKYSWKPSDRQMNAILDALDYLGGGTEIVRKYLMSLYEQLKKLKE